MMRPNWFLALRVPPGDWYPSSLPPPPEGFRCFHPEDLHVTVAFLGNCGETAARRAWGLADAWDLGPLSIALGELVPMGNRGHYSALSFLLTSGRELIEAEIEQIRDELLVAAGGEPESRRARAHVTVARPPRRASAELRQEGLRWAGGLKLEPVELLVSEISLYTWNENRASRLFQIIESRELTAS
jgi:RNA 2',3'-cyclic 3'-phosphodiesterase